jgi:acetyl-CoA carboxylase biotin carboxyl carrier protein
MESKSKKESAPVGNSSNGGPDVIRSAPDNALPLEEIERLVELVRHSGIGEIQVRLGELRVTVRALYETTDSRQRTVARDPSETAEVTNLEIVEQKANQNELHEVLSPVVGTFYRAPAPGEPEFVRAGDQVEAGQILCIVEAMKLMNEIPSDVSGEVVEILPQNGEGVHYGQPLFRIRPKS